MKTAHALAFILGIFTFTPLATAGPQVRVFINSGGFACAPAAYVQPAFIYHPTPVCHAPAPVAYYRTAPLYSIPAPVMCVPATPYRAPITQTGITLSPAPFCWH